MGGASVSPLPGDGAGAAAASLEATSVAGVGGVTASALAAIGVAGAATGAAGTGAAGAGAGVAAAGAWKAGCIPAPISLRSRFAASASFLSHAKYACDWMGISIQEHPPDMSHNSIKIYLVCHSAIVEEI